MKCLLATPAWKSHDVYPNKFGRWIDGVFRPLGILYVASSLIKAGHDVRVLDGAFLNQDQILAETKEYNPKWIGISSNIPLFRNAQGLINLLKIHFPDIHLTLGGPAAIGLKQECLNLCESIDSIVYGEGDLTALQLVDAIENDQILDDVRGIVFRKGSQIRLTPPMPLIDDLDTILFPARDLVKEYDYRPPVGTYKRLPSASIFSSRGCPYDCIYCFKPEGKNIRFRSPENFMKEVDELVGKYKVRELRIWDDGFTYDLKRAERICDMIIEAGYDLTWYASARVDKVNDNILKKMKEAGCWAIMYGVESGLQKNLDMLKKGVNIEQIRKAVDITKKAGIKVITPFMFGIPGETFEDGLKTIEFACSLDPDYANFHNIVPYPGTELYENAKEYGTLSDDMSRFTFEKIPFVPYSMTEEELVKLRTLAFKRFYGRPRYILKKLLTVESAEDLSALIRGFFTYTNIYLNKNLLRQ